jgi:hypothetical protein
LRLHQFETIHLEVVASEVGCLNILQDRVCCKCSSTRDEQGRVIGNGIHGSLNVFFTPVKHNNKLLKGHDISGAIAYIYRAKKSPTLIASVK